jgi:DTW domain-containing protein YfiP
MIKVEQKMDKPEKAPMTAAEIARKRFEAYIAEKLRNEDDLATWEFYTWILEKAKRHEADSSGYAPLEYQEDREAARKNRSAGQKARNEFGTDVAFS